jgi:hypothetical protein
VTLRTTGVFCAQAALARRIAREKKARRSMFAITARIIASD